MRELFSGRGVILIFSTSNSTSESPLIPSSTFAFLAFFRFLARFPSRIRSWFFRMSSLLLKAHNSTWNIKKYLVTYFIWVKVNRKFILRHILPLPVFGRVLYGFPRDLQYPELLVTTLVNCHPQHVQFLNKKIHKTHQWSTLYAFNIWILPGIFYMNTCVICRTFML